MATNILSSLLNAASEGAGSAMRTAASFNDSARSGSKKNPEQEAFKQILAAYAKDGDIEAISRLQAHANNFGMGNLVPALVDAMGGQERLDAVKTQKEQSKGLTQTVMGLLTGAMPGGQEQIAGGGQQSAMPAPVSGELTQATGMASGGVPVAPAALPPPSAPGQAPSSAPTQMQPITLTKPKGRLKPKYSISTFNVDPRSGEVSNIQLTDSSNKTAMSLQDAVDQGALTQDDANSVYAVNQMLVANGLMDDPNNKPVTKFMTDRTGRSFMQVGFPKTGESIVVPAGGVNTAGERPLSEMRGGFSLTPEETAALNVAVNERRLDPNRINSRTGKLFAAMEIASPGIEFAGVSEKILESRTATRQREGVRSASLQAASQLYDVNTPKLLELRKIVAAKNALPKNIKAFNSLDQWAREETGDPDVAEFKGKVLLLSEALQRTFASGQGGEWAFELAKTLIDSSLPPEAFERRLKTHREDLHAMVAQYKTLGKSQADFEKLFESLGERANNYETKAKKSTAPGQPKPAPNTNPDIDAEADRIIKLMQGAK